MLTLSLSLEKKKLVGDYTSHYSLLYNKQYVYMLVHE